jgi:hypothetical protein
LSVDERTCVVVESVSNIYGSGRVWQPKQTIGEQNVSARELHAMVDESDFDGTEAVAKDTFVLVLLS